MKVPGRSFPRLPAHQATTRHLCAAYPLLAEPGLGHRGVLVGHDLLGGSFVFDPFELYEQGVISNPNTAVFGQIGRGKSAFVKTYLWRQAVFGRRAWVVDPKGEYASLAEAWGVRPVALRPGGPVRLNPLDPGPDAEELAAASCESWDAAGESDRRQLALLGSLAAACLGRDLGPRERASVDLALVTVRRRGSVKADSAQSWDEVIATAARANCKKRAPDQPGCKQAKSPSADNGNLTT